MSAFSANWMGRLDDGLRLSDLTIPGTHDSCTFQIDRKFVGTLSATEWTAMTSALTHLGPGWILAPLASDIVANSARCQTLTLRQQLDAGIRFLDIRLKFNRGKLRAYHGIVDLNLSFQEIFDACTSFLGTHKGETIILSVKDEESSADDDLMNAFWPFVTNNPGWWFTADRIPMLKEVRGRIVLMRRFFCTNRDYNVGIDAYNDWPQNTTQTLRRMDIRVQDEYQVYVLGQQDHKFKRYVEPLLREAADERNRGTMFINFTSGTGGVYPRTLATGHWSQFKGTNVLLLDYVRNHPARRYGIIPMDFPEYPNGNLLINALIACNDFTSYDFKSGIEAGHTYTIHAARKHDQCIDVYYNNTAPGSAVKLSTINGGRNQEWTRVAHEEGSAYFYLVPKSVPGAALTVSGAVENGTKVVIEPRAETPSGQERQLWMVVYAAPGQPTIRPKADTRLCLDVAGGMVANNPDLAIAAQSDSDTQQWRFSLVLELGQARPLYRYVWPERMDHLYTTSKYDVITSGNYNSYELEALLGFAYDVRDYDGLPQALKDQLVLVYRWYKLATNQHFFTTIPDGESATALGYRLEGPAFYLFKEESPGRFPLFRLLGISGATEYHLYTTAEQEYNLRVSEGWADEGILGYLKG